MPYIRLVGGISIDEYVIGPTCLEYNDQECVIEHPHLGTVGRLYDPETKTFVEPEVEDLVLIEHVTLEELMGLDAIRAKDPVVASIISKLISHDDFAEGGVKKFVYLVSIGALTGDRVIEILLGTKYEALLPELMIALEGMPDVDSESNG